MEDCVFCKIAAHKLPFYKIYEDRDFMAFLNIKAFCEGHALVIPKKHYRWVWDIEDIGEYFAVCQKIARRFQVVTGSDLVISYTIGENQPHAHVHLLPNTPGQEEFLRGKPMTNLKSITEDEGLRISEKFRLEE